MQWILQEFQDTNKLAEALSSLGIPYSFHKVVPFVGDLVPDPIIDNPNSVVLFGSYSLWKYASKHQYKPGVFKLRPFLYEQHWHSYLLNGREGITLSLREIPEKLDDDGRDWFIRPVDDSKEESGNVKSTTEIMRMAARVLALREHEIPGGSLRHDTLLMLSKPVHIIKEWRLWIVEDQVITYSLYKEGTRVIYRHEIDDDALEFATQMVSVNPRYAQAYVIDICRTEEGLKLLETNCINAAGFYAADLIKLAAAINSLDK